MADINLDGVVENAANLNNELDKTNKLLGNIETQKGNILGTSEKIRTKEYEISTAIKSQNQNLTAQTKELQAQNELLNDKGITILEIIEYLKAEIGELRKIYDNYDQINEKLGKVNRGTKKSAEFEEERRRYLNQIKDTYESIKEAVKDTTNASSDATDETKQIANNVANVASGVSATDKKVQALHKYGNLIPISEEELEQLHQLDEELEEINKKIKQKENQLQFVQAAWKGVTQVVSLGYNKWAEIDQKVVEFGRHAGLAANQIRAVQKNVLDSYGQMAAKLGMTYEEIFKFQEQYVQNTGRAVLLTNDQVESLASMSKLVGESAVSTAVQNMDDLGASTSTASDYLALTMARARAQGLDATKASEAFANNIKMASRYTFRDGMNGISKMTMLSQQLKFNMESIGSTIEKFSTIEGAIETSANIQMLGGAYAANFANPLEAMGEALMDAEGFINRIVNTVSSQATFNRETGQVEMAAFEKRRLQEFAKQMGMNYDEAWNMVAQQTKIQAIGKDTNLNKYNEADQALIANKAQYDAKEGRWEITLPGQTEGTAITALTEGMLGELRDYAIPQESIQKDVHEIHRDLRAYIASTVGDSRALNEIVAGIKEQRDITLANIEDPLLNGGKGFLGGASSGGFGSTLVKTGMLAAPVFGGIAQLAASTKITKLGRQWSGIEGLEARAQSIKGGRRGFINRNPQPQGGGGLTPRTIATQGGGGGLTEIKIIPNQVSRMSQMAQGARVGALMGGIQGGVALLEYGQAKRAIEQDTTMSQMEKAHATAMAKKSRNEGIGNAIGSVIGGALGSFIPIPGIGTMIGATIGGQLGGWIGGATKNVTPLPTVGTHQHINENTTNTYAQNNKISIEPISLNVNGSIKLVGDKYTTQNIDLESLLRDPKIQSVIVDIVRDKVYEIAGKGKNNKENRHYNGENISNSGWNYA